MKISRSELPGDLFFRYVFIVQSISKITRLAHVSKMHMRMCGILDQERTMLHNQIKCYKQNDDSGFDIDLAEMVEALIEKSFEKK